MENNVIQFGLDLSIYPEFITMDWVMTEYNISRQTVAAWIQRGVIPPYSTPIGSRKPGWSRAYFLSFLTSKGAHEGKMAAESGIFATAG